MFTDNLFAVLVLTAVFFAAIGLLTVYILKRSNGVTEVEYSEPHPRGYWVSTCLSIGAGFGVALGTVIRNIALGIAIGCTLGVIAGGIWEKLNLDKLRQPSQKEKLFYWWAIILGLVILLAGVGGFMFLRY